MLRIDILRLISLKLDPHKLSICKELHNLYNDSWYQDKLLLLEPNRILDKPMSKDLYKEYMKEGFIYRGFDDKLLRNKGIKAVRFFNSDDQFLILTFD